MTEKFVELSKKNYSSQDQDVVNIACYGKIITVPPKYNAMTTRLQQNDARLRDLYSEEDIWKANKHPYIIHYADKNKPWNSSFVYMEQYWWNIARKTPYIDLFKIDASFYKTQLEQWWYRAKKTSLNLDNPKTFNEKIQWMKLYDSTPLKTRLADKYLVRDWVKEKIGEEFLIPLLGVYDRFEDIDFDKLPNQFVIKCNHGSAYNIIVKDKSKLDLVDAKAKLDKWMNEDFAFKSVELHYRDIEHKIIIEKYMDDGTGDLRDYKYTCFNGKPEFIWIDSDRHTKHKRNLYDLNWKQLPYKVNSHYDTFPSPDKPERLDEMTQLAKILSEGFSYVRVDFYIINGKIYFGEMTFTSSSGTEDIVPESFDRYLAKKIKLPKLAYNIDTGEYYKLPKPSKLAPYLFFPYYLFKVAQMRKKVFALTTDKILSEFTKMRIDIKNSGTAKNALSITAPKANIDTPAWFTNARGIGQMVQGNNLKQTIKIKAINDGKLIFDFRGQDKRDKENQRIPLWCDYQSIKIDGKKINDKKEQTWHDKPYHYEMPVKDGQEVKVEIEQTYHRYMEGDLRDTILELFPSDKYITENIDKLTAKIFHFIESKASAKTLKQKLTKKEASLKLFKVLPIASFRHSGGKKVWKIFGLPVFKKRMTNNGNTTKYYILGINLLQLNKKTTDVLR